MVLLRKDETWCTSLCHTLDDMRKTTFSDVIIQAEGDDVLKAHNCILAAASPVLKTRLVLSQHYLYIPKISKRTWEILLQFIYTGNLAVSQVSEIHDVLRIAKQLEMTGLTSLCKDVLKGNVEKSKRVRVNETRIVVETDTSQDKFAGSPECDDGCVSSVVEELQKCTPQEGTQSPVTSVETSIEDDFDGGCESNAITQETNRTESEHDNTADDDVADDSVDSVSQQVSNVLDNTESETIKSNENPVSCEICGKMFRKNAYLRNHLFQHTGERPYKCWDCGLAFTLQSNLNRHKRIHTGKRSYECSLCDKSFSRRDTLSRHKKVRHNDEKPFPCPQCGKRFKLKHEVPVHMRIHADDKPFVCEICGKTFSRMNYLAAHRCTHSDARPHQCPNCPKSFKDRASVNRHQLTHSKLKWHMCPTCGKMYSSKSQLVSHEYGHRGLQIRYPCSQCGKGFSSKSHVVRHMRNVHENRMTCSTAALAKQVVLISGSLG